MTGFNYIYTNSMEIKPKNSYLKIPVELCIYAFKNKVIKPFKLYNALNACTQGNIVMNEKDIEALAKIVGYSTKRSVKNNLRKLRELGWVGYDVKENRYWIRGFDELRERFNLKSRKAVEFGVEYLDSFELFCFSAIVGRIAIYQGWRRRSAWMKSGKAFPNLPSKPGYIPIANKYLTKVISISNSNAARYKKLAKEEGYMDVVRTLREIPIKSRELSTCKSNDFESYGNMFTRMGRVVQPGPDLVRVILTYRRRKNLGI